MCQQVRVSGGAAGICAETAVLRGCTVGKELMQLLSLEVQNCFTCSAGAGAAWPSPDAGAMGVAGSPLRLTAPICWMWHGEKATPGLR